MHDASGLPLWPGAHVPTALRSSLENRNRPLTEALEELTARSDYRTQTGGAAGWPVLTFDTEVFSTDWSLGGGQDQGCSGDRTDPLRAQADVA